MKYSIISSLIVMLLMSLTPHREIKDCNHCVFTEMYENTSDIDPRQPRPYIHKDSMFILKPIIDNIDEPKKDQYMNEFRMTYKDLHYCSDSTKLTLYTSKDSIVMLNIRPKISCKIDMWYRLNNNQVNLLKFYPLNKIRIENLVTDNVYTYNMSNPSYFIKSYEYLK